MVIALLTAAGKGNRMGQGLPKQFMCIDNKPVIIYTLEAFQKHPEVDAIAVACLKGWEVALQSYANQYGIAKLKWIFEGGNTNQESIFRGLCGLREQGCSDMDIIMVHDGVRPLVSAEIISNNISTCKKYGSAVTGLVCKEAIMELVDDTVSNIDIPRERLVLTQTPHTYRLGKLLSVHEKANAAGLVNTVASCTLVAYAESEAQYIVEGSERNGLKLTRPQDVDLFEALIHTGKEL